jgi:hypothetical protein
MVMTQYIVLETLIWVFPIDLGFPKFYANAKAIILKSLWAYW